LISHTSEEVESNMEEKLAGVGSPTKLTWQKAELEAKFNLESFPPLLAFTPFVFCLTLTPESNLEHNFSLP